jgi:hypothetical protein
MLFQEHTSAMQSSLNYETKIHVTILLSNIQKAKGPAFASP